MQRPWKWIHFICCHTEHPGHKFKDIGQGHGHSPDLKWSSIGASSLVLDSVHNTGVTALASIKQTATAISSGNCHCSHHVLVCSIYCEATSNSVSHNKTDELAQLPSLSCPDFNISSCQTFPACH